LTLPAVPDPHRFIVFLAVNHSSTKRAVRAPGRFPAGDRRANRDQPIKNRSGRCRLNAAEAPVHRRGKHLTYRLGRLTKSVYGSGGDPAAILETMDRSYRREAPYIVVAAPLAGSQFGTQTSAISESPVSIQSHDR